MEQSWARFFGLLAVAGSLQGCGEASGDAGNCGEVSGCGGNIVGTWKISEVCVKDSVSYVDVPQCPQLKFELTSTKVSGAVTYGASDYSMTTINSGSGKATVPSSCLQGGLITCQTLPALLALAAGQGSELPLDTTSVSCANAGDACTCTGKMKEVTLTETGTYGTSGSELTETPSGSTEPRTLDYCVKGKTLHRSFVTDGKVTEDMVASKQ